MTAEVRPYVRAFVERHQHEFAVHGATVGAVSWTPSSQRRRFEVIGGLAPLQDTRVLDVGCGFGDFLTFLGDKDTLPASYTGIDVVPEFIDEARRRHPQALFQVADILDLPSRTAYDYCVASGIFYLPSTDWMDQVRVTASKMFALSEAGIALNFLSQLSQRPDTVSYYADPGAVVNLLAEHVSRRLVLRHDYLPNDFTVYLYKPQAAQIGTAT